MAHGLPCRSGLFDNVDARVVPGKKGKCKLMFVFKEKIWPQMSSFAVEGASLIPPEQVAKVMATHEQGPTSLTDGVSADWTPWEGGPGHDTPVDRAVLATRHEVFPHLGLDPLVAQG